MSNNIPEAMIKVSSSLLLFQDPETQFYTICSIESVLDGGTPINESGDDCVFVGEIEPWIQCGVYKKLHIIYP